MFQVALILSMIWGITFLEIRKRINSGKIYFYLLFLIAIPSFFEPKFAWNYIDSHIDLSNIVILGILMILSFIPWYYFDKCINKSVRIIINDKYIDTLKYIFLILIIGSIFSIIYLTPYAIKGLSINAADVRSLIQDHSLLPSNYWTTLSVTFAGLHIYCILFFYISFIDNRLKHYRIWLFISSLSYVISCLAFAARDGFAILIILFIVFYLIFNDSIPKQNKRIVARYAYITISITAIFIGHISLDRFQSKYINSDNMASGTIGYIMQQPYIFDTTVQMQDDFHGVELRFPLINRLLGVDKYEVERLDTSYETRFGTMYADFYNMFGWSSVIAMLIIFISYYYFSMAYCYKRKKIFAMILIFTVYLYIAVTGIFYCKAGSSISMNIFFISISVLPLFIKNYITIKRVC